MRIDMHTHGKLAKYLPFSPDYTTWLLRAARQEGLDALCLTEHFNTLGFAELYQEIARRADRDGDAFTLEGVRIFAGMETDIAEGGHVLSIGPMPAILELQARLAPHARKGCFLPWRILSEMFSEYPLFVGAAHPYRIGGHIPELGDAALKAFDFFDLNGKDVAMDREGTIERTYALANMVSRPVLAGSDTHQALQFGTVANDFQRDITTIAELRAEAASGRYEIVINPAAASKVSAASLLKRSLKEIDALGGDYVAVLLETGGESAAVAQAKARAFSDAGEVR